jgi:glycosyltransferase involved in cell wall biosynthesis
MPHAGAGPEVVPNGFTGITYGPDEPDGLVLALCRTMELGSELKTMGQRARTRALTWFTPARCASDYLHLAQRRRMLSVTV